MYSNDEILDEAVAQMIEKIGIEIIGNAETIEEYEKLSESLTD